mmetsp:Transcript_7256/g.12474  ORF Transcript_7256/g.12474 Transcript_7256/m.12474 type:complete len:205 (+) Transcript_7256:949-1563(+)
MHSTHSRCSKCRLTMPWGHTPWGHTRLKPTLTASRHLSPSSCPSLSLSLPISHCPCSSTCPRLCPCPRPYLTASRHPCPSSCRRPNLNLNLTATGRPCPRPRPNFTASHRPRSSLSLTVFQDPSAHPLTYSMQCQRTGKSTSLMGIRLGSCSTASWIPNQLMQTCTIASSSMCNTATLTPFKTRTNRVPCEMEPALDVHQPGAV